MFARAVLLYQLWAPVDRSGLDPALDLRQTPAGLDEVSTRSVPVPSSPVVCRLSTATDMIRWTVCAV